MGKMSKEEFEALWKSMKEAEKRRKEEYNKLPPEEKERIKERVRLMYKTGFAYRISEGDF